MLFACRRCLPLSITSSCCVFEAIDLPLLHLNNVEKLHNACWIKNTIAIVCCTQRHGDDIFLKASVYVRLQKPGFAASIAAKKMQVLRFAATTSFFWWLIWMLKSTVFISLSQWMRIITAEAIVSRWKLHSSARTESKNNGKQKEHLWRSGDAYLDDFIITWYFLHIQNMQFNSFKTINRNIQILSLRG